MFAFRPEVELSKKQELLFLDGRIDQPINTYPVLEQNNYDDLRKYIEGAKTNLGNVDAPAKFLRPYEQYAERSNKILDLLEMAKIYNESARSDIDAKNRFMQRNIELYGEPDQEVFEGLVANLKEKVLTKDLKGRADIVRQELLAMLPETTTEIKSFRPNAETMEWVKNVVELLFEDFLAIIPDQEKFTPGELRDVFNKILSDVVREGEDGWRAVLSDGAKAPSAISEIKRVEIPNDDMEYSQARVRQLTIHELGVHVLRSIMGDNKNISSLRVGLPGYSNAEEGLAIVFEQGLGGKYEERGGHYYLIAGYEYLCEKNFREAFEMMWRRCALNKLKDGEDLTDEAIRKAKKTAYSQVFRINRGTDTLPWFKDLAYYNGNMKMWRFIEENQNDPDILFSLFQGKFDPENIDHMRAVWDAELKQ